MADSFLRGLFARSRRASHRNLQVRQMLTLILSRFIRLLVLPLFLSGCMTTPVSSIPKLMRLDFLTMNFEHVRVGLQLPTFLSLRAGDAVMIIRSGIEGVKDRTVETFELIEEDMSEADRARFSVKNRAGWGTTVWRIKPEDVARLTLLQEKVRRSRIEGPRIRGSTEIEILRVCAAGTLPSGPIYFSTYIKPAENEDYIPMSIDADLVTVFGAAQIATRVSRCEG
nr:hypothetical protein [uncultured Agrobacterium sp.]